jgi:hypothetical protein
MEVKITTTTLPAIGFNFEALRAWATGLTAKYSGLIVQDDDVPAIKSEMAGLNKLIAQLEDARKATVRQISEPIKDFEAQVKEVVGIFSECRAALDVQVKAHEAREREGRRVAVQFIIDAAKDEHGDMARGLAVEIKPNWLNKTATPKSIRAEVDSIILAHIKAEREKAELAQAKQDRAVAIEKQARNEAARHGFEMPTARFFATLSDLQIPLAEVFDRINAAYEAEAKRREEASRAQAVAASAPEAPRPVPVAPPAAAKVAQSVPAMNTVRLVLSYTNAQADAVERALQALQAVASNLEIKE